MHAGQGRTGRERSPGRFNTLIPFQDTNASLGNMSLSVVVVVATLAPNLCGRYSSLYGIPLRIYHP